MKIFTVEQFEDLPEGSTVIVPVMKGVCRMIWRHGQLHGDVDRNGIPQDPRWVLAHYGPLDLVAARADH